jgi:hypothetical protein
MTMVRELYLDTERPVDLSSLDFQVFQLKDMEDEEQKLQGNVAYVLSKALNYASSLIRYLPSSALSNFSNDWFDLRDRVLQDRVQT